MDFHDSISIDDTECGEDGGKLLNANAVDSRFLDGVRLIYSKRVRSTNFVGFCGGIWVPIISAEKAKS
jgi:hypothetical protein